MNQRAEIHSAPSGDRVHTAAVTMLLTGLKQTSFTDAALSFLSRISPIDYVSVAELMDGQHVQLEGRSVGAHLPNITQPCFSIYKERFSHVDEADQLMRTMALGTHATDAISALALSTDQLPSPDWQDAVYKRWGLTGRISFLYSLDPGQVCALHLYRDQHTGPFSAACVERLFNVAPLLRSAHHLSGLSDGVRAGRARTIANAANRLTHSAALSERERAICARIVSGLRVGEIAQELGIAKSTVQTLRKRAYAKLHIHGARQLAALI